jgi:C4-dicarboxylate transporter DctM subunit
MTVALAILALLTLIAAGIHVGIALGIIAAGLMLFSFNIPPVLIAQTAWGSIDGSVRFRARLPSGGGLG